MFGLKIVKVSALNALRNELNELSILNSKYCMTIRDLRREIEGLKKPQVELITDTAEIPLKEVKSKKSVKKTSTGKVTRKKAAKKVEEN